EQQREEQQGRVGATQERLGHGQQRNADGQDNAELNRDQQRAPRRGRQVRSAALHGGQCKQREGSAQLVSEPTNARQERQGQAERERDDRDASDGRRNGKPRLQVMARALDPERRADRQRREQERVQNQESNQPANPRTRGLSARARAEALQPTPVKSCEGLQRTRSFSVDERGDRPRSADQPRGRQRRERGDRDRDRVEKRAGHLQ